MPFRHLYSLILISEALLVAAWWGLLLLVPVSRTPFRMKQAPDETLLAFLGPDVVMIVGLALVSAYGIYSHAAWKGTLLCLHAGAIVYATLYCWTLALMTGGEGLLGAIMMLPLAIVAILIAALARPRKDASR